MQRQPLAAADTSPAADRVQIELLRNATVARRTALAVSLSRTALGLTWRALQRAAPDAGKQELGVRFVALCYGPALAGSLAQFLQERGRDEAGTE